MTATKWIINSNQSDVLIKSKRSINTYLGNKINSFNGSIAIKEDALEDATVEFSLDLYNKEKRVSPLINYSQWDNFFDATPKTIQFKSTSFQKINSNINFLKGNLTINNITKVVELDAVLTGLETQNGISKAIFEIFGTINRKDFKLSNQNYDNANGLNIGQNINLTANLEFTNYSNVN